MSAGEESGHVGEVLRPDRVRVDDARSRRSDRLERGDPLLLVRLDLALRALEFEDEESPPLRVYEHEIRPAGRCRRRPPGPVFEARPVRVVDEPPEPPREVGDPLLEFLLGLRERVDGEEAHGVPPSRATW